MKMTLFLVLTWLSTWFPQADGLSISEERVACIINRNMNIAEFDAFATELWEKKKIRFSVDRFYVNKYNQLTKVKISVNCNDGYKGSAELLFEDEESKVGFYRVYNSKDNSPFGIGSLPSKK